MKYIIEKGLNMIVEPITSKTKIKRMYNALNLKHQKYGLLFKFALNTGLKVSDILPTKVTDIFNSPEEFKEYLILKNTHTNKENKIKLNTCLRESISYFMKEQALTSASYLFYSSKGGHLQRIQAYKVLKEAATSCGIENFATESLRKTWGYWAYEISENNLELIMHTFNHTSQSTTLSYIGITKNQKNELYSPIQF